jgi:hypothetical protein
MGDGDSGSLLIARHLAPVVKPQLSTRLSQYFALHVGPAIALKDIPSTLGQHDQASDPLRPRQAPVIDVR